MPRTSQALPLARPQKIPEATRTQRTRTHLCRNPRNHRRRRTPPPATPRAPAAPAPRAAQGRGAKRRSGRENGRCWAAPRPLLAIPKDQAPRQSRTQQRQPQVVHARQRRQMTSMAAERPPRMATGRKAKQQRLNCRRSRCRNRRRRQSSRTDRLRQRRRRRRRRLRCRGGWRHGLQRPSAGPRAEARSHHPCRVLAKRGRLPKRKAPRWS
mmetsp:Transcript_91116/g.294348  ORF Transcript_91116/g.294348 Transcript_91116/m.294348 type:complete len:211 (+) Transcript_91116:642-1274(+)